ncbi:MAG: hypothetical protein RID91_02030 [Azospirillaceae bacterium]
MTMLWRAFLSTIGLDGKPTPPPTTGWPGRPLDTVADERTGTVWVDDGTGHYITAEQYLRSHRR